MSAQTKSAGVQASFEAQLAEQRRAYERMQAVQLEIKADEEKLAATVGRLRRKMDDSTRNLSASEGRRDRLKQELARAAAECVLYSKQKEDCTAEIHEATKQAAKSREEKLRRACGGSAAAASAASSSAAAPARKAGGASTAAAAEPNLLGDDFLSGGGEGPSAAGGGGWGGEDLLGLEETPAPPRPAASDPWGGSGDADLLGDGPVSAGSGGGGMVSAPTPDAFSGFDGLDCASHGAASAPAQDPFGLDVRGSPHNPAQQPSDFWGSSPLGALGASPPPPPPKASAPSDPFAGLSSLGAAMPRKR